MSTVGEITAERDPIMVATPGSSIPGLAMPSFVVGTNFVVGLDLEGHWLAVETHGKGGGIFVSREAALDYARSESCHRPGSVALASTPIALR